MGEEGAPTLYTTDDTGNYVEYTPPEPLAFHDTLPEDLRGSDHLKEVENGDQLARYYVDLKSNYLKPPDTADGYEFDKPDGFELDTDMFAKFKNIAFENGVNQKQFTELMNLEVGRDKATRERIDKDIENTRAESEGQLKTEWGDKYDQKVEAAKGFLNHESVADESFKQFLEDTKFGDNPQVIRLFAKLSNLISEDAFVKPGTGDDKGKPQVGEDGRPMLSFPSMQ